MTEKFKLPSFESLAAILVLACLGVLVLYGFIYLQHAVALIRYPYQVDYGEGSILGEARQMLSGHLPYHNIKHAPFLVGNYPPVYPALVALGLEITGSIGFAPGRILATAATLGCGLLIALIVFQTTRSKLASVSSGLLWFGLKYVYVWGSLQRIDTLAIFAGLLGFWWVLAFYRFRLVYLSAIFFLIAVYTRQDIVFSATAAYAWLFTRNRRLCLVSMLLCVVGGLAVLGSLQAMTDGQFFTNIVTYENNRFDLMYAEWAIEHFAIVNILFFGLGSLGALISLAKWKEFGAVGLYYMLAGLELLTIGKVGSSVNYFLDFLAASCIAIGVLGYHAATASRSDWGKLGYAAYLSLFLVQLCMWRHPWPGRPGDWAFTPHEASGVADRKLIQIIRATKGPVISENMGLLAQADKPAIYQPFIMTQLANQGDWNENLITSLLRKKKISLLVLGFDAATRYPHLDRFNWTFLRAVKNHYMLSRKVGAYFLYVPVSGLVGGLP